MIATSFVHGIVIFLDLTVFIYAGSEFCTTKGLDQHCKFKCHCNTLDYECIAQNGTCGGYQSNCAPGWIGPKCQYSNIAYIEYGRDVVRDGNHNTCSRRTTFTIDFLKYYAISSLTVYTENDSYKPFAKATVKNSTDDQDSDMNTCVGRSEIRREKDFTCRKAIVGRYLVVMFVSQQSVCEIGINDGYRISNVRDGNYITCSRRKTFTIDLLKPYPISSFVVIAQNENHKTIAKSTVKNLTQDEDNNMNTCVESSDMKLEKDFICTHTIVGRYLVVMFASEESVCEIGIHGGRNIALWQNTDQSGTLAHRVYTSDKAVDGDIGGYSIYSNHCTHTAEKNYPGKPFWSVSFGQTYYIQRMQIHFRKLKETIFRFSDYSVTIMDRRHTNGYYKKQGIPVPKEEIIFTPALGSNVTIQLPNKQSHNSNLNICEVQVFACQLRANGETCTNTCPINCRQSDAQYRCQDYTCPENQCIGDWKGKYCNQKECNGPDLKYVHLRILNSEAVKSKYLSGDKVSVVCLPGYTMNGNGLIECKDDGRWQFGSICRAKMCTVPNDSTLDTEIYGKHVQFSDMVEIKCKPGYQPRNGLTTRNCDINGAWENGWNVPTCEANRCMLPNDVHTYTNMTGESDVIFGTSIKIACDPGYQVKVSTVFQCQLNGTWSNTGLNAAPVCEEITCDLPKDKLLVTNVTNGNETVSLGTTIMISCKDGYELTGPMVSCCQPNGTWNPEWNKSTLLCKEKKNYVVAIGVGIGSAVFIAVLLIVGIALFMNRRNKRNQKTNKNVYNGITELDEGNVYCNIQEKRDVYETVVTNHATRKKQGSATKLQNTIKVGDFKNYVDENKGKHGSIVSEFDNLSTGLKFPSTVACLEQNEPKNKYENIHSYDANRVVLSRPNGESNHINATYINGYNLEKSYVATQDPLNGTEEDFWEMVYQLNCDKIVMLTKCFEESEQKCVQYWPDEEMVKYGTMSVHLKTVDQYADFTLRVLSIRQDGKEEWRNIRQFHFTSWSDNMSTKNAVSLNHFRKMVVKMPSKEIGPIIVHCSDGIGKTGVFVALDILVAQARSTGQVNVLSCVETLRHQRVNMVKTPEQYLFLHYVLKEELMTKVNVT